MIFQNHRLILARKIVIEWRFHVFGFMDHSCLANRFGKCKASTGPNHIKQNISKI